MNADRVAVLFADAAGDEWQSLLVTIHTAAQTFDTTDAAVDALPAASDIWTYATRTLTQTASTVATALESGVITIQRGDSLSVSITGMGDISTRTKLWFTVKESRAHTDAQAIIQIEESAGLVYVNGADASARAANGSITVDDAAAGDITVALDEAETDDLSPDARLYYDYLDISITTDDPLLSTSIESAQKYIDSQTNRHFEAETDTRYYERSARDRWNSRLLNLHESDLLTVTELLNGDADSTEIVAANYWLTDAKGRRVLAPPYHGILLKTNVDDYWEWDTDYWVTVTGTWGYSATAPDDIRRATLVLASYFYRQKDAQMFETTAIVESGAIAVPQGIPATVDRILKRYKRLVI